ncbi:hypothetical protein ERD78_19100 [Allopusillimonas soli]|uniref:Lipoprotein n=1 Tax=Allopusillimonas soli TaxID=659016 RepID=A0A853FKY8_9BURK|nr:hypothetical protein [Allopusillimonas soli]NYT39031.1 hypothetical protein [Allopusillimonas soli]TEA69533.1 hypothetical protein ERD78_19100 [Allopusillimonas soli]
MKPSPLSRLARTCACAALASLLSACANMAETPPGSALSTVEARFGQPDLGCPGPDGTKRLVWTQQPLGQYAWGTHVDASGNIDRIEQILTDQHFNALATGTWTPEQVRCEFGPPAIIDSVGLPSNTKIVWSYRYKQAGVWNSLMYVYFGTDGKQVTRFHPGPDPMFEDHDNFWIN